MVATDSEYTSCEQKQLDQHMPTDYKTGSRMTSGK